MNMVNYGGSRDDFEQFWGEYTIMSNQMGGGHYYYRKNGALRAQFNHFSLNIFTIC